MRLQIGGWAAYHACAMSSSALASAPGSLMLFGEHAVLRGYPAIVAAVSARVRVAAAPRKDGRLRIRSGLGELDVPLHDAPPPPPAFRFAQAAAVEGAGRRLDGLDIEIESDALSTVGLGTSAAVTVAVLAAVQTLAGREPDPVALLAAGRRIVRATQGGVGSGADVAASVFGGALFYRMDMDAPEGLPLLPPMLAVYSGHKTPTAEVIRRVAAASAADPSRYGAIFERIGETTLRAAASFRRGDSDAVGGFANAAHEHLVALGVCDDDLAAIVAALRGTPGVRGAKISGSGLGDCAIGFGNAGAYQGPGAPLAVALASEGARWMLS